MVDENKEQKEEEKEKPKEEKQVADNQQSTAGGEEEQIEKKVEEEKEVSKEEVESKTEEEEKEELPDFRVGDTVKVMVKIKEGDKERIQPFQGVVISKKGRGISKTFTVRKIAVHGIGVERIWPLYSPSIADIKIIKQGKVRRAKLYYLRDKVGKEALKVKSRAAK